MLSSDEARLLDLLTIAYGPWTPIASAGGVRRARARGAGGEFHEYRRYQAGDDPRSIDWTVEARLRQLVVRVSRAEGQLALHVLLDTSASMGVGSPTKLACAARAGAALCYVAIEGRDAAGVATFDDRVRTWARPAPGRRQLARVFDTLGRAIASGASSLDRALQGYAAAAHGPGLVAVVSDFFGADAGTSGLHALAQRGLTPVVIQVVAPEELEPVIDGDVELWDVEDEEALPLAVSGEAIAAYRERLQQHAESIRAVCAARRWPWIRLVSNMRTQDLLLACRTAGLLGA